MYQQWEMIYSGSSNLPALALESSSEQEQGYKERCWEESQVTRTAQELDFLTLSAKIGLFAAVTRITDTAFVL